MKNIGIGGVVVAIERELDMSQILEVLAADLIGHVALVEGQDGDLIGRQLEHLEDETCLVAVQLEELGDRVLREREPFRRYVCGDARKALVGHRCLASRRGGDNVRAQWQSSRVGYGNG